MLSILVWNSVRLITSSHAERMEFQVNQDANLLASSLAPGLAAADRAVLLDVLSLLNKDAFVYVGVYDQDEYLLAKKGVPPKSRTLDSNFEAARADGIYDSEASIKLAGQSLGKVRIGVSLEAIEKLIADTRFQNTLIAILEIILTITVTLILGIVLTRHLRKLEEGAVALSKGELSHQIDIDSNDEIGDVARGFNNLAKHLAKTQADLEKEHIDLRESEEKYRLAMDAAHDGIWDWNISTGTVDYSANWGQIVGESELANDYSSWEQRIHPDDKEKILTSIDQHLQNFSTNWQQEHRLKHKNGSWKWVLGRGQVVEHDENDQPLRMVGTMIDISRQKKLEEELQRHRSNLESLVADKTAELEAAKNEAETANLEKSKFLANMSHELRTPMHSILSFASLALKRVDDEKSERFLQNIRTSGIRLTALLNDLLDLSKLESGKLEGNFVKQDMTTLIEKAINEISSLTSDKNILIKINTQSHFECVVDQQLITRVMINLFSNAIKFSPENSQIYVEIERHARQHNDQLQEIIQVSVQDNGIGIPSDQLENIFDKFIQSSKTKSQSGGTGLGLSISKQIIELHGGKIWAQSPAPENGKGSVFTFFVPVVYKHDQKNILDTEEAISHHRSFKNNLLDIISTKKPIDQIPSSTELDEGSCPLTPWINSQKNIKEIENLKKCHEDFHNLAAEIIAYYRDGNDLEVTKHLMDFILISEKITKLLDNHSNTAN